MTKRAWRNYRTGEVEFIETPKDLTDYVEDVGYPLLSPLNRQQGMTVMDAIKQLTTSITNRFLHKEKEHE